MSEPGSVHTGLRPLGIGEMLDRAVTLSVRYFIPLALIWVVFIVPMTVFQYYGTADMSKYFGHFIAAANALSTAKTPAAQRAAMDAMSADSVFNGFTVGYFVLLLLVSPLASAALMKSCGELYLTQIPLQLGAAYRDALKQWLHLIAIALIWIVFGLLAYLAVLFTAVIIGIAVSLLFYVSKIAGIAVATGLALIFVVALILAGVLALLSAEVAFYTQVIEELGFARSFARGLSRVLGSNLKRSIGVGLALVAVDIGFSLVAILGQFFLFGVAHSNVLGTAFSALLGIAGAVFIDVFMVIFYYDIRVRSEGLDLQLAAGAPQPSVVPV